MTEERSQDDPRINEHDLSMEKKTRTKEEKYISQSSYFKYSTDTMVVKQCKMKPLKKESEEPFPCKVPVEKKKAIPNLPQVVKMTVSKKHPVIDTKNHGHFSKQSIAVQIPKVYSPKSQVKTLLKNKIFPNEEQSPQRATAQSQTCSTLLQATSTSEKNQICPSKTMITQTSSDEVCFTPPQTTAQPTRVVRYQAGSHGFKKTLTTIPIRSGLRLLSIVSTESSPNIQIATSPEERMTPAPSVTAVKTPSTKDGLLTLPVTTSKTLTTASSCNSTVTTPQILLVNSVVGTSKSPITTQKISATVNLASSSNASDAIQTMKYAITSSPRSPITTLQKPFPIGLSRNTTQQSPTIKNVPGTPNSSITKTSPICSSNSQTTPPPLKENESARITQSEPTFKTWIPSDIDPMSQTFLRMPFTYQSLQVQCKNSNRPHVKRPMNAFMVWAKKNRASIAKRFPNASNSEISVRLGYIWNELPSNEQKPYFDEANDLKEKHKHENPNWVYQPRPGKKCRKALFTTTVSKSQPTSPVTRRIITKSFGRPIHPRSAPSSPAVKRPLWLPKKSELSEEELQSQIVEDLLEEEIDDKKVDDGLGNPTMDTYIDEWLSPKRTRRDESDLCLMNDAMLPRVNDDEQDILEEETRCDGRDFEKYIKQLRTERNNFTKLENNISNLKEEDEMSIEGDG